MIITAPITDYIPASLLTANGDIVSRYNGANVNFGAGAKGRIYVHMGANQNLSTQSIIGALDHYYKGQGGVNWSIFEALALRDTGIHIGNDTRNAAGDQVIAGVGFESSVVIFLAVEGTAANDHRSEGFSDGTVNMCMWKENITPATAIDNAKAIYVNRGGGNSLAGTVSAIGADGFTITWVLNGNSVCNFTYLCLP